MVLGASGVTDQGVWMSIDAYFQGGFNATIGGRVRHRRPELSLILLNKVLAA